MKLYISGPITGLPGLNRQAFDEAAEALQAAGFEVVNPHMNGMPATATWAEHMRADIRLLLDCDALALLPGWMDSRGAMVEWRLAVGLGMPCNPVAHWLADRREVA